MGLILDGNRRWAREKGVSHMKGHYKGKEVASQAGDWFFARGVKFLSLFVFSVENWNRASEEVDYLMTLLREMLKEKMKKASRDNFRFVVSGREEDLPRDIVEKCRELEKKTRDKTGGTINLCLNYGGQIEIVDAVRKIIAEGTEKEKINEDLLAEYLYHSDLPPLDMVVRTSGEQRISGFQLWRSAYAEFLFLDKYWPDFSREDVDHIIAEFSRRQRRFGGDVSVS